MLRFYNTNFKDYNDVQISDIKLTLDENIWKSSMEILKKNDFHCNRGGVVFFHVNNLSGEHIAYGYQDNEANRELRMLKELMENEQVLQFTDVFSEYREVVIVGCNELAVAFAGYLDKLGVDVSVLGKYWDCFGYKGHYGTDFEGEGKLVVYAEGMLPINGDLDETLKRSVSSEFECIDKIYETNVLKGFIQDTAGTLDDVLGRLNDEQEIFILGDDNKAQDTYDFLLSHGIDICGFALMGEQYGKILGRPKVNVYDVMRNYGEPVFIDCNNIHGALGVEWTEFFDYRGYVRNEQFFLIKDYTDIPVSNLVHVFHGKNILLTGDFRLCQMLADYLNLVEDGEVSVKYMELGEKVEAEEDDISCLVIPNYKNRLAEVGKAKLERLNLQLGEMNLCNYTRYFIDARTFALIDIYLNRGKNKYPSHQVLPKGILLGRIPSWSGNVFLRGVIDGHPEILIMPYSDLNENLFYYCIRLAYCSIEELISEFWALFNEEAGSKERYFPYPNRFDDSVKRLLDGKRSVTSQELFVIFHIAYIEMISNMQILDISKLVIYWEPHFVPREYFPFYALWLEDERINGLTIALRRNQIVRTGSACKRVVDKWNAPYAVKVMFSDYSSWEESPVDYQYWEEFKMRFEDIKLNPMKKLGEVCQRLNIEWSDSMLKTTSGDKPQAYRGSSDFDLKAVFNDYADYLSQLDRFRISIASSPYQKRHGYPYENCLKFSRVQLRELFYRPFLFDEMGIFENSGFIGIEKYEWLGWQMWNVRKHMMLDDIYIEFGPLDFKQAENERIE